jgi:hypothetical protein
MGEEETEWMVSNLHKVDKCKRGMVVKSNQIVSELVTGPRESFVVQVSPCPILCKLLTKKKKAVHYYIIKV